MNRLDLILVVLLLISTASGWRLGFLQRTGGWIGAALGIVASLLLIGRLDAPSNLAGRNLLLALGAVVVLATLGSALGSLIGARVLGRFKNTSARKVDSLLGAASGAGVILLLSWVLVRPIMDLGGWSPQILRDSQAVSLFDRLGSPPEWLSPNLSAASDIIPGVVAALDAATGSNSVKPPLNNPLSQSTVDQLAASVVRVSGNACGSTQAGSGVVVRGGIVATNAHVVAGSEKIHVALSGGSPQDAALIAFDPVADLALLRVDTMSSAQPVEFGTPSTDDRGAVLGFRGGTELLAEPFAIGSMQTLPTEDIFGKGTHRRDVLILGSNLGHGDSGAPLANTAGQVVGLAFAISTERPGVAYGIPIASLEPLLTAIAADPNQAIEIDSGPCLETSAAG